MVRRLLIVAALSIVMGELCCAQTHGVKAVYAYEMGVPESVKAMPEGDIKDAVLEQIRAKGCDFDMYYSRGVYGFARSEAQLKNGVVTLDGDGAVYVDAKGDKRVSSQLISDKPFIVTEKNRETEWVVGNETKEILGKRCVMATAILGKTKIEAWFCPDIPLPIGPAGYGGLPGIIMQLGVNVLNYTVRSVEYLDAAVTINPPQKGTAVTRDKFNEIQKKKLQSMGMKSGGGIRVIGM